jgi:alkylated DNA repair dioxygenase AlkB
MDIYGKCNDVAHCVIDHLQVDHKGYLPELNSMFSDEISLSICMDCGQIQNWEPIADKTVLGDESIQEELKRKNREVRNTFDRKSKIEELKESRAPSVINFASIRRDPCQIIQITPNSFIAKMRIFDDLPGGITHDLLEHYKESLKWSQDVYSYGDKQVAAPRMIALMGERDYFYSGINHVAEKWDEETLSVRNIAWEKFNKEIPGLKLDHNGVLFNHYRNGQDSIGAHSDNEACIDMTTPIMSINLGGKRTFVVTHKNGSEKIPLIDGEAILMLGDFQDECKHSIPKETGAYERINLTFRRFK